MNVNHICNQDILVTSQKYQLSHFDIQKQLILEYFTFYVHPAFQTFCNVYILHLSLMSRNFLKA